MIPITAHPSRRTRAAIVAWLIGIVSALPAARADVFQNWYQHNVFKRLDDRWSVGNSMDLRVTDGFGEIATTMFSPRVRRDLGPHWSAQLNTTWLEAQAANERGRTEVLRLETELNPRYALTEHLTFSSRNRFEWRFIEDVDDVNQRIRLRPQLDLRTPWAGPLRGVFVNNEAFYDFDRARVTENRLVPFGLVFQPTARTELRVYHLWRRTLSGDRWFDFHVLGLLANMNF